MAMVYQVAWAKCNVFDKDGNATTYERNDLLPDGIDEVQLGHLRLIGAIRIMESVPTKEEMRAELDTSETDSGQELTMPADSDLKAEWVAYVSDPRNPRRMSAEQADSMSKTALMAYAKE